MTLSPNIIVSIHVPTLGATPSVENQRNPNPQKPIRKSFIYAPDGNVQYPHPHHPHYARND